MGSSAIIMGLVLFTLLAGLAIGFYQLYSVERAKDRGVQQRLLQSEQDGRVANQRHLTPVGDRQVSDRR